MSSHTMSCDNMSVKGGLILGNASLGDLKTVISQISNGGKSVVMVNGKTYTFEGAKNVSVINGKILVDGKEVEHQENGPSIEITITIHGDVGSVETGSGNVTVNGNVSGNVEATSGDVQVSGNSGAVHTTSGDCRVSKNVEGPIATTSGNVESGGNVDGSVRTVSGDVKVHGEVQGDVNTVSGDVTSGGRAKQRR
jgi:DUF4097 and DUF4098 domain-containing protein YvlB